MGGKKKGGSSHTPVEAKETGRSFQIARILEVLSEGEIHGLVDDMASVYLDKTPLQNKDGTFNFKNISVYANAGTQDQDVLQEFNAVEKEVDVGTKVLKNKPIIKTVTDKNVTRVRMTLGVERLLRTEDNGDVNPTSVTMKVEVIKDNKTFSSQDYTFNGKYSNTYREMFDLTVPKAPFSIKVSRITDDSLTNKLQNNCFWSSYTEIIDKEFAYPNTALVGVKIDSEYFNNIPTRNYEIYGMIVKVPSNYDAFNHTYTSDFWDGSFKLSWTNNPAWVLYDLVTNTRYGMGKRLAEFGIDKWQLYAIGKYCDELVPDGFGGKECRMTCNIWITDQRKAYDLVNDICSIFRAMPVWNGQALTAIQDRASDPVWTYNNANTIGGFTRQRSAKKARHNVIQVEYVDADDFYEKKVESVSDDALVARYGQNVKKITAFGCTSRGQAYRTGRWLLETEKLETETITFTVGQEGLMHLPYDVIEVADSQYAGVNVGGRILATNGTKVTLDRSIEVDDNSYLSYVSAKGYTETVKIISFDTTNNVCTVAKDLTGTPELTVWGLTTKRITTGLYRAISIKENDSSDGKTYTITALQHVPEKEDIVVNGTHFDPKPQTVYGDVIDADINYDGKKLTVSGKINGNYDVLSTTQIVTYTVKLLKDGALVYIEKGLKTPDINVDDLGNGSYEAQISAYNDKGQLLKQYTKTFVIDRPPLVANIKVNGHLSSIVLTWDAILDDVTETEIWSSETDNINSATLVTRIKGVYYSHEVGAKKVRYYWLRHKRGVNVGSFDQVQGRKGESGTDIDAELEVLNKELSKNIVNEFIDTALPARKLGMTKYVENLDVNVYQGQGQVYDETSNKMYTWNGAKYVPLETELLASKIKGIIQPEQLAPIPTTNLAGKLSDAQIEAINSAKLIGVVGIDKIPSIPTTKLTGSITNAQIQELDANKIRTGTINIARVPNIPTNKLSGQIADAQIQALNASKLSGTVSLDRLPTVPTTKLSGQITDAQLASVSASKIDGTIDLTKIPDIPTTRLTGTVSAKQISANAIGANHIASNAITSDKIAAGQVTAGKIGANAVEAGNIKANAIGANHITAGAITASKMVMYGENMILDPLFEDKDYWRENIATVKNGIDGTNTIDWSNGKITVTLNNKSVSSGTYFYGLRNRLNFPLDKGRSYRLQCRIKVVGDTSIADLQTSAYLASYPTVNARTSSDGWANLGKTEKYGARDELVSCVVKAEQFRATDGWLGVYLRIGGRATSTVIGSATIEFSELELIKMSDADLIVDGSITSEKIVTGAISADKLATNSITSDKIQANAITTSKILTGAIDARTIASNAITSDKILANAVTAVKINSKAITADKIDTNAVTSDKINANAITAVKIASNAVETSKIKAGAITTATLATGAVNADKIATNAITSIKISANAITAEKLAVNSVGANAIQAGAITTDKLGANSVDAGKIKAGAINANHIQAGQISTDKLAIGLGGNLLQNPIFANNGFGWTSSNGNYTGGTIKREYKGQSNDNWNLKNPFSSEERMLKMTFVENITTPKNQWADAIRQKIRLIPNQWYIFSCYVNSYRCGAFFLVEELDANGAYVTKGKHSNKRIANKGAFINGIDPETRDFIKFQCPASGHVEVIIRCDNQTDSNPDVYIARPMLEECTEYATAPSAWVNAGVTAVHGGSIVTNTITAQQIQAGAITANEIASGTIEARNLKGGKITAGWIGANEIDASKLKVSTLSAVSSNLGTINAGSIKIGSMNGSWHGTMFEVQSTGGFILVSRDGQGGIELSSSTRALKVWNGNTVTVQVGKL